MIANRSTSATWPPVDTTTVSVPVGEPVTGTGTDHRVFSPPVGRQQDSPTVPSGPSIRTCRLSSTPVMKQRVAGVVPPVQADLRDQSMSQGMNGTNGETSA